MNDVNDDGIMDPESSATRDRLQSWEDVRWALLRNDEVIAQFDSFGWLELGHRKTDLHARYRELNGLFVVRGELDSVS